MRSAEQVCNVDVRVQMWKAVYSDIISTMNCGEPMPYTTIVNFTKLQLDVVIMKSDLHHLKVGCTKPPIG